MRLKRTGPHEKKHFIRIIIESTLRKGDFYYGKKKSFCIIDGNGAGCSNHV